MSEETRWREVSIETDWNTWGDTGRGQARRAMPTTPGPSAHLPPCAPPHTPHTCWEPGQGLGQERAMVRLTFQESHSGRINMENRLEGEGSEAEKVS